MILVLDTDLVRELDLDQTAPALGLMAPEMEMDLTDLTLATEAGMEQEMDRDLVHLEAAMEMEEATELLEDQEEMEVMVLDLDLVMEPTDLPLVLVTAAMVLLVLVTDRSTEDTVLMDLDITDTGKEQMEDTELLVTVPEPKQAIALALVPALDMDQALALDRAPALDLDLALDQDLALDRALDLAPALATSLAPVAMDTTDTDRPLSQAELPLPHPNLHPSLRKRIARNLVVRERRLSPIPRLPLATRPPPLPLPRTTIPRVQLSPSLSPTPMEATTRVCTLPPLPHPSPPLLPLPATMARRPPTSQ